MALAPRSVADFYFEIMELLNSLGINLTIDRDPKEVSNPIRFDQDTQHATYVREMASRHWLILSQESIRANFSKASATTFPKRRRKPLRTRSSK